MVGKAQARFLMEMLGSIFDELSYVGEYTSADGVVLLSTGVVAGKRADGIQVITVDEAGLITQMRDFVRPLSALSALSEAAKEYMTRVNPGGLGQRTAPRAVPGTALVPLPCCCDARPWWAGRHEVQIAATAETRRSARRSGPPTCRPGCAQRPATRDSIGHSDDGTGRPA